jgi:hypothetical protein
MAHHAYDFAEAAWLPAEFVKADGLFDIYTWEEFLTEQERIYEHLDHL